MDADGDYIPKSALNGNIRSVIEWNAWKKAKYNGKPKAALLPTPADKGIHWPTLVPANNGTKAR